MNRNRFFAASAVLALLSLCVTGCQEKPAAETAAPSTAETTSTPGETTPPTAESMPAGGGMNAPFAGGAMGGTDPTAPLSPTPDLDKKIAEAEKGGNKKAIAVAYTERGKFRTFDDKAGARTKYRKALEDFRVALKNDPKNADALQFKKEIEDIYTSMGRPIPGTEDEGKK